MKKRTILLHSHIFKNAGSTIGGILKANFSDRATFLKSKNGQFISNEKIISTCLADEDLIAISSHKMRVLPPQHPNLHFVPLVMLRNPLDRLGSIYHFYRAQKSSFPQHECKLAQRLPFKDFVKVLVDSGNDSSFANLQTQLFLGMGLGLSKETWPTAVMNFQSTACVGVVEKFNESMVLWSKHLAQYFATIDFSYKKMNVSKNRAQTEDERISVLEEALGEELLDVFRKRNQYDYQLYGLALERIERELCAIGACHAEIASFSRSDKTPPIENEVQSAFDQVVPDNVLKANTNLVAEPPLCLDKDGVKLIIPRTTHNHEALRPGTVIVGCGLFDANNQETRILKQGQSVSVLIAVNFSKNTNNPIIGITVKDSFENIIFGMNTNYYSNQVKVTTGEYTTFYCFQFIVPPLNQGSYSITPAIAVGTQEQHSVLDVADDAIIFFIPAMINPRLPGVLYLQDFKFLTLGGN